MSEDVTGESSESLRGQELDAVEVVRADDFNRGSHVGSDRWLVLVDETGAPTGAIGPEREELALVIVAEADLPVGATLTSPVFDEMEQGVGVVVTEHDGTHVLGVLSGTSLNFAMQRFSGWNPTGHPGLAGTPDIIPLMRPCTYVEGSVTCNTLTVFDRKPAVMPPCDNDNHLTAHDYVW